MGGSQQHRDTVSLDIRLQCRIHSCNPLRRKSFHGVLAGNVQECSLKLSIGKVRVLDDGEIVVGDPVRWLE